MWLEAVQGLTYDVKHCTDWSKHADSILSSLIAKPVHLYSRIPFPAVYSCCVARVTFMSHLVSVGYLSITQVLHSSPAVDPGLEIARSILREVLRTERPADLH